MSIEAHECDFRLIEGSEYQSEYEPTLLHYQQACTICGMVKFCTTSGIAVVVREIEDTA